MAELELTSRGAELRSGFSESHIVPFLFSTRKPHLSLGEFFSCLTKSEDDKKRTIRQDEHSISKLGTLLLIIIIPTAVYAY